MRTPLKHIRRPSSRGWQYCSHRFICIPAVCFCRPMSLQLLTPEIFSSTVVTCTKVKLLHLRASYSFLQGLEHLSGGACAACVDALLSSALGQPPIVSVTSTAPKRIRHNSSTRLPERRAWAMELQSVTGTGGMCCSHRCN